MKKATNYIIFHPKREKVKALATVMYNNSKIIHDWEGQIFVDDVHDGNEDPFVFNNPWIYSYCHASQLKRSSRKGYYLQPESKLIFISGPDADRGFLTVDTVFVIDSVLEWGIKSPLHSQDIPLKYLTIKNSTNSDLWERHFKFPFEGEKAPHKNTLYSYEAKLWEENIVQAQYSYLPLTDSQEQISIPFSELPPSVMNILIRKKKGKFPAEIDSEVDINEVLKLIESKAAIKVLKNIKFIKSLDERKKKRKKNCGRC
ncbi:MAG: hypothetical protein H6Q13_2755 [Bacteroidetes bacterium]|nr:hypothetical protein [Bacteroidota bacterium]